MKPDRHEAESTGHSLRYFNHGNRRYCVAEGAAGDAPAFSVIIIEDEPGMFKPLLVELATNENCRLAMTAPFGNESFDLIQKAKAWFGNGAERFGVTIESPEKELLLVFLDLRLAPDAGQRFRTLSKLEEAGWDFWAEVRPFAEGRINIASRYTLGQIESQAHARGLHLERPNYIPIEHKAGEDGLPDETRRLFLERVRGFQNEFRRNSFHIRPIARQVRVTFYHDTHWEISGWRHCEQTYAYVTHMLLAGTPVKLQALTAFKETSDQKELIKKWSAFCEGTPLKTSLDNQNPNEKPLGRRRERADEEAQQRRDTETTNEIYEKSRDARREWENLEKRITLTLGRLFFQKADTEGKTQQRKKELERIRDIIVGTQGLQGDLDNNHKSPGDRLQQLKDLCPNITSDLEMSLKQLGRLGWGRWILMFIDVFLELLSPKGEAQTRLRTLFGEELDAVYSESAGQTVGQQDANDSAGVSTEPVFDIQERINACLSDQLSGWITERDQLSTEVSKYSGAKIEAKKRAREKKGQNKKDSNPLAESIAKQFQQTTKRSRIVGLLSSYGCPFFAMHLSKTIKILKEDSASEALYDGSLEWHVSPAPPVLPPHYDESAPFHRYLMEHLQAKV